MSVDSLKHRPSKVVIGCGSDIPLSAGCLPFRQCTLQVAKFHWWVLFLPGSILPGELPAQGRRRSRGGISGGDLQ
jgi:hypothetical protein